MLSLSTVVDLYVFILPLRTPPLSTNHTHRTTAPHPTNRNPHHGCSHPDTNPPPRHPTAHDPAQTLRPPNRADARRVRAAVLDRCFCRSRFVPGYLFQLWEGV
ncbi:hypothetical protein K458DRAFT_46941 [Lentithecium fluviatile CBS 122367]|uniref:Uncharacterized protein n=1 Tax=Lentithecium fluviatile CBS 122367 TaxID=1168545 RepID=A0A6G1IYY0_9PLEO|nr:hypothetical protein K458DRAFT_46941 [Lentithecium fluviatile CBS 122367]